MPLLLISRLVAIAIILMYLLLFSYLSDLKDTQFPQLYIKFFEGRDHFNIILYITHRALRNIVQWLKAQMLKPDLLGLSPGLPTN